MRGFWIDERYEWNIWTKKRVFYVFLKYIEKKLLKNSDIIIVLCDDAKFELQNNYNIAGDKINVIPTCVDTGQFKLSLRNEEKNKIIIS